jgi:succinoglycan biosynthesis transport protein ExoP
MSQSLGPYTPDDNGIEAATPRSSGEDFSDFGALSTTLWRRKFWILAGGFVAAAIAALAVVNIPSTYVATADVQLDTRQRQVIDIANVVENQQFSDAGILSEVAVLRSTPILRDVALRLDLAQYAEFYPVAAPEGAEDGAADAALPDAAPAPAGEAEGTAEAGGGTGGGTGRPPHHVAADILRGKVNVVQVGLSYILRIEVSSLSPDRAAAIANALAEAYLQRQIDLKVEANDRATDWLSSRVEELGERVERSETEYETARAELARANGMPAANIDVQLGGVSAALTAARSEEALAESRLRRFAAFVDEGAYESAMRIASSPALEDLVVRRADLLERRGGGAGAGPTGGAFADSLQVLERRIAEEARIVETGLQTEVEIVGDQVAAHVEAMRELELDLVNQSADTIDLRALARDVEAQRGVYQTFLTRLTEARERGDFQEADAQIISYAEAPRSPASPRRTMITVVAFALGSGVALLGVMLGDARRRGYRTATEAQARTGRRVIAVLPKDPLRAKRLRDGAPQSLRNAVHRLRALLDGEDRRAGRSVMIASTLPGEGSGALAVLLAQACGLAQMRVAFVDFDATTGGAAAHVAALGGDDALSFEDHSPVGAAAAQDAAGLLATLRRSFDLIVVHAPPVLADAESLSLARLTDHVALAFQWEKTPDAAVVEACDDLVDAGAHLVGLVMTETDLAVSARYEYRGAVQARRAVARYADAAARNGGGGRRPRAPGSTGLYRGGRRRDAETV